MKRLIVLVTILSLSLTAFSQQDTTIKVKCLPVSTFKQIAQDLLKGDLAIAQLKLSEQQIIHIENKVVLKDSVINTMKVKESNYIKVIDTQNEKYNVMEKYSKKLEWDLKKEKVKGNFKSIIGTGLIAVLTFLLITK
jgi:hypothetical protein